MVTMNSTLTATENGEQAPKQVQHTPGPWCTIGHGFTQIAGPLDNGERWLIAETISKHGIDKANARLIAAAPDMLRALQQIDIDARQYLKKTEAGLSILRPDMLEEVRRIVSQALGHSDDRVQDSNSGAGA